MADIKSESGNFLTKTGDILRKKKMNAIAIAGLSTLALAGCAETTAPLEVSHTSVLGTELPDDLATARTAALEICNTGEGADKIRQEWKDLGYEDKTGMKWIDAFTFSADYGDFNDAAVIDYGQYRYPIINEIAKNCLDAAKLVSIATETDNLETATAILDEMHALPYDATTDVLAQIAQNAKAAK